MNRWWLGLLGLLYSAGYLFVAVMTSGGGHGPRFTFAGLMPYGAGLLVFPVLGFLMGNLQSAPFKIAYGVLLLIHSATVVGFVVAWWAEDQPYVTRAWDSSPLNILLPVGWYLTGQIILWATLLWAVLRDDPGAQSNERLQPTPR
jgi:hypothetical protein